MNLKVALIGYGRMGKTIDALAETYSCDIVERLDIADNADGTSITPDRFNAIDVAIDFSLADAVVPNMKQLGATNTNVVLGTTGWHRDEQKVKDIANETGIGVVHAANFSIGVNLFQAIVEHSAALFSDFDDFGTPVMLTYKQLDSINTTCGGVTTIFFKIVVLLYVMTYQKYLNKKIPYTFHLDLGLRICAFH